MSGRSAPVKVGDRVTTDFNRHEKDVVRTLTEIEPDERFGSGFRASADGGSPCSECGRPFGSTVDGVDASWFRKVDR